MNEVIEMEMARTNAAERRGAEICRLYKNSPQAKALFAAEFPENNFDRMMALLRAEQEAYAMAIEQGNSRGDVVYADYQLMHARTGFAMDPDCYDSHLAGAIVIAQKFGVIDDDGKIIDAQKRRKLLQELRLMRPEGEIDIHNGAWVAARDNGMENVLAELELDSELSTFESAGYFSRLCGNFLGEVLEIERNGWMDDALRNNFAERFIALGPKAAEQLKEVIGNVQLKNPLLEMMFQKYQVIFKDHGMSKA